MRLPAISQVSVYAEFSFFFTLMFFGRVSKKIKTNYLVISIINWANAKFALFNIYFINIKVIFDIQTKTN